MQDQGRTVGVDVGSKRVGVAIADPLGLFVQPYGTFSPDEALKQLVHLNTTQGIGLLVVGWPLTLEGEEGPATEKVQQYINRLAKRLPGVQICKWDERFTSEMAKDAIRASGRKRKVRDQKGRVDAAAAAILLQDYMDR